MKSGGAAFHAIIRSIEKYSWVQIGNGIVRRKA